MILSGHGADGHTNRYMHTACPETCVRTSCRQTHNHFKTCACSVTFCCLQLQALTCRAGTHGPAVKPVCVMLSLCTMLTVHVRDVESRTRKGLLTSNDDCAIFSNRVTSTEGVGGEMEGGESLAGNVIDGTNLSLAIAELQRMHAPVSRSGRGEERRGEERRGEERRGEERRGEERRGEERRGEEKGRLCLSASISQEAKYCTGLPRVQQIYHHKQERALTMIAQWRRHAESAESCH